MMSLPFTNVERKSGEFGLLLANGCRIDFRKIYKPRTAKLLANIMINRVRIVWGQTTVREKYGSYKRSY